MSAPAPTTRIEPLDPERHGRGGFSCGVEAVDNFLKKTANKLARAQELLQKYGVAESDCTNLMLIIAKAVQMAADGNLKAAEFIRDTLGENPQYKIYEKRLEYLIADKEAAHTLADEWVASIPDWEE